MMPTLTRRQQTIYAYLQEQQARSAPPPTLDELCQALGLRSRGSLHKHIQALIAAGLVEPMHRKQRGVRLAQQDMADEGMLPLLGYIAAGHPIEAVQNPDSIEVPAALRANRRCYVLQVKGDSMVDDGILDGDWVVIEHRTHADNGEIVVALIDGSEATLKRIDQRPEEVLLHSANPAMEPLRFAPGQVRIQGVVIGQMRRYG